MASSSEDKESKTLTEETLDFEKNTSSNADGADGVEGEGSELTLAQADELFEKGSKAIEDDDYADAADCLSRALEIRVSHYGELANECVSTYYKYGAALLYKAQEETGPLGKVPAKQTGNEKSKSAVKIDGAGSSNGTSLDTKLSETGEGSSTKKQNEENNGEEEEEEEAGEEATGEEETGEEEEEEDSDLDLSWKMLDIARAIVEKTEEDTLEKVKILSALGEVSLENEDTQTSFNDYMKALSIAERLFEPDHRRIVELNFRLSLVLELGAKIEEAIPYCAKAVNLCKSNIEKLKQNNSQDEIELLSGVLTDLENKLEELEQAKDNPNPISVVSEVMEMIKSRAGSSSSETKPMLPPVPRSDSVNSRMGTIISSSGFDSPSISTATGGSSGSTVTHLGVVGRGVKRAVVRPVASEENGTKKQAIDSSEEKKE